MVGANDRHLKVLTMRDERAPPDRTSPVSMWKEDDVLDGRRVKAQVIILRTKGCWWAHKGGCTMCGYNNESILDIGQSDMMRQLEKASARYQGEPMVKVYTSGSFLDENELPADVRDSFFERFSAAERILFESRPEFITKESLQKVPRDKCMTALGLETSNDELLVKAIRKGFRYEDYQRAAGELKSAGIPVRTYLLLKPPLLTEVQGIADAVRSINMSAEYSESISINPINVQSGTRVEELWRRGDYRPPWLWSLVEVIRQGKASTSVRIMSAPSGAGTPRGVHNCPKCDRKVLDAIERFTFSQDLKDLDGLECSCMDRWRGQLEWQGPMRTSVDVARHIGEDAES
ncbi:MAG: hypothetical protein A4E32_01930 [Methanomassiliicoccales archaeon PtaU1.Bin124]|nr:MAG: hypothetical protein A4E32_01930 [Methanomassiliicoccales archaeon PtaU1.Bin124]